MARDVGIVAIGLVMAMSLSSIAVERADLPGTGRGASDKSDSSAQNQPNIIFFITDDYGWQDTSEPMWEEQTDLNKTFRTPNMERLARRGVKLTNAYTSCSVCSASRISILTGQNPVRHGTTFITGTPGKNTKTMRSAMQDLDGIQKGDVLLPELLRKASYRTVCIGKSHFGREDSFGADPLNLGFDRKHYANHHGSPIGKSCGGRDAYHVERTGQQVHLTEALTLEAKNEISAAVNDGKPFFLYLSHYAIHTPILEDPRFKKNYPNLEGTQRAYATLIEGVDKSLGDIVDHVETLGIAKNTLIIWTADNGGLVNNVPLRGLKNDAYEGGHRVPNIVAWGAQDVASQWQRHLPLTPGRVDHRPYIHTDWMPTLLRLTGAAHPKPELLDGYDITDLLSGREEVARPELFFWHEPNFWAHSGPESSIREGSWKLIYLYDKSAWELYDLTQDIGERTNQANRHPEVVSRLARKLIDHLDQNGANYPIDVATGKELPPRLTSYVPPAIRPPGTQPGGPVDLSGQWRFVLDPEDLGLRSGSHTLHFPDTIHLPGTTAAQGKGRALKMELRMDKETMNRLRERHPYIGPAWYQREITIPADWSGQDILLTLERVLWESRVWIDKKPVGNPQRSLSVPHRYDLTSHVKPGETHTLTMRIDNRQIVDIGNIGHAYTAGTQTIWNGVLGELKLEALPKSRIEHVELSTKADGRLTVNAHGRFRSAQKLIASVDGVAIATAPASGGDVSLSGQSHDAKPWSELSPALHELTVSLIAPDGTILHTLTRRFGFREFTAEGRDLRINGTRTFLRGNLECAIFPQTGHPDVEGPQWEKIMRTSRDYGLNHLRFHSWCPPEAAFESADRHGIYLQVELPNWTFSMGGKPAVDAFFLAEGERIFREYGHHPSFVMFSLGNELKGDLEAMDRLVERFRTMAPGILFTSTTFAFSPRGSLPGPADDFFISQRTQSGWVRGQGFLNATFPSTDSDYAEGLACLDIPLVTHEVGQYVVYPNLAELPKYESTPLRSPSLEVIQHDLREKGLLADASRFTRDSGKLAALLYKEDIERALRTKGLAGIQLLQLQDFPGQSTATVGLLDAFWDSKGLITPKAFREFCSPVVPLVRMNKFVWENSETFVARFELANFSEAAREVGFNACLATPSGKAFATVQFDPRKYGVGNGHPIGHLEASLANLTEPTRLDLIIEALDGTARNTWPVWVYPKKASLPEVSTYQTVTDACLADLAQGKTVLLLPQANTIRNPVPARFIPVFWSPLHFPNQPGTLGATIDAKHPLWKNFPTDTYTNWQWWELTAESTAIDLTGFDPKIEKPFRFIDKYNRNAVPTAIFEARVGTGKLLVCTLDVTSDSGTRIVARQLHRALTHYAGSTEFEPAASLTPERLRTLFRDSGGITADSSSSHPDFPADLAIDGDPATIWHSEWRDANRAFPITFTLDLQQPTELAGLRLRNRAGNQNGRIRDFRIDVSLDNQRWRSCGDSSLPNGPDVESVKFEEPVEARYVRISATSSHAGPVFASLAEVEPIPADSGDVRDLGIVPGFNDKPNIVWIMAEDISTELSCYGHPAVKTPNLDALARQGARYTQAFCTAPSCTPSRNAMMTGVYQTRTDTQDQRRRGVILPEGMKPITHLLREAGYFTALGCGYSTKTDLNFEAEPLFDGRDWSQRKKGQPFFAQITLNISHRQPKEGWAPVRGASEHPVKLDEVELPPYFPDHPVCRQDWAEYLDSIEKVDSQVAAILERLRTEGIEDNTIVIFIGDNGRCHLRGKCWLYDGGIHVPLIIRWPGAIKSGMVNDDMVSMIDISATILDIAGAELPTYLDGHSILGERAKKRDHIFAARDLVDEVMDHIRCVRTKRFKYIRNYTPENGYRECSYVQNYRPMLAVIRDLHARDELTEAQQLILAETKPEEELYDVQDDPHELSNLAQSPKHQKTLAELRVRLDEWIADTKDKGVWSKKSNEYLGR
ncbi:Arylsulfatase [Planctomycetes bacterium CA13]|uniref:Arylsulfatase n=1 Tax=Novipirellula herctigrandis TaxID=2527986 RepID=A0A5C5Z377_9BACT|nr:Arylsulfatase [Planctomycetes bacterium CA13]